MKLFHKILCPIDFSEDSVKALQWTRYLAKRYEGQVTILHVMEPYPAIVDVGIDYDKYHSAVVRDMKAFLAPLNIPFESMQSSGSPAEKIPALATTLGSSVIVMGTRGLRGTAHRLIGSTTESVIRHSSVPVITLSPKCCAPGGIESNQVLLPVSSLNWPARGFIRLRQILRDLNGSLTMMHVVDIKDEMFNSSFDANPVLVTSYQIDERKKDLERIGFQIAKNAETIETILQFGNASPEILKEAEAAKYGWILMGAKRQKLFSRFFDSTAYNVISQAPVPVITIRV